MQSPSKETDILTWQDVFQQMSWLARVVNKIFNFFRQVLLKRSKITIPLIIFCILGSLFLLHKRSRSYGVTTTFVYSELHPKIFGDMIQRLNELFYFDRVEKAAALLNLKLSQARLISNIQSTDTQGRSFAKNYAFRKEPMVVTINLSGPMDEDSLRQGITQYLNSNPFTENQLELKKQLLREEKDFVEDKILGIDSLLKNLYQEEPLMAREQTTISIEGSEGKDIYELLNFSRELIKRKGEIENQLARPENVIAIDNFIILPKAKMDISSIIKNVAIGSIVGFLISCLLFFGLSLVSVIRRQNVPSR